MKNYILQYSIPTDKRIAVSDWREYITKVQGLDLKDAVKRFNAKHQHLGNWLVLDCWEDK